MKKVKIDRFSCFLLRIQQTQRKIPTSFYE